MAAAGGRKRSTATSGGGRRGYYALTVGLGLLQLCLVLGTAWRFAAFLRWQQQQQQQQQGEEGGALPLSLHSRLRGASWAKPAYAALSAAGAGGGADSASGQQDGGQPPVLTPRHRVAVLLPYLGRDFPPWFRAFADACGGSSGAGDVGVDWVVLHEGTRLPPGYTPPANVRLVDLGPDGLATAFLQDGVVLPRGTAAAERAEALRLLKAHFSQTPAMLIQFKPALGAIFADLLQQGNYTHWGYGDMDMLMGRLFLPRSDAGHPFAATSRDLEAYDALTFSFGDQFRGYLRGQLTIHKIAPWSQGGVFRLCPNLGGDDSNSNESTSSAAAASFMGVLRAGGLLQASSEGCYSRALLRYSAAAAAVDTPSLRIKYALGGLTDASLPEDDFRDEGDVGDVDMSTFHEALVLHDGRVLRCARKNRPLSACALDAMLANPALSPSSALASSAPQREEEAALSLVPVPLQEGATCMWWVPPEYQVCLPRHATAATDALLLLGGRFYKQPWQPPHHQRQGPSSPSPSPSHVWREGVLMHFQEWKKAYPYWAVPNAGSPGAGYAGVVVTAAGFVPVPSLQHLSPGPTFSSSFSLGPGFHCLRFVPNPLNPRAAPPVCTERAYPLSIEEEEATVTAVARRQQRVEGLEKKGKERASDEELGVTLLLLARGDAWGANAAGREGERAAVAEAAVVWVGGEVIVVEYRDASSSSSFSSFAEPLSGGLEGREGAGRVRVLPFVVPGDSGGRQRARVLPLKAMVNRGLDAVRTRFVLPLDPAKLALGPETYQQVQRALRAALQQAADDGEAPHGLALLLRHVGRYGEGALYPLACDADDADTSRRRRERLPALPPHVTREGLWAQGGAEGDKVVHRLKLLEPGDARKSRRRRARGAEGEDQEEEEEQEEEELTARPFFSPFQHWTHPHVAAPSVVLDLVTPAGGALFLRQLEELGGDDCYDGMWAWALSLLGYRFYLATDAALRVRQDKDDGIDTGLMAVRACGCASGVGKREVALALEALEKWVLRTRNLWEELRWRARALDGGRGA